MKNRKTFEKLPRKREGVGSKEPENVTGYLVAIVFKYFFLPPILEVTVSNGEGSFFKSILKRRLSR